MPQDESSGAVLTALKQLLPPSGICHPQAMGGTAACDQLGLGWEVPTMDATD